MGFSTMPHLTFIYNTIICKVFPLHCIDICFSGMATFHARGKAKLIVPFDDFGILHVIKKCLCVMFGFHPRTIHVSKDRAYDANYNVIRSIY
jgi:hypothetical protein